MIGLAKLPIQKSVKKKKVIFRRFSLLSDRDGKTVFTSAGGDDVHWYTDGVLFGKDGINCGISKRGLHQGTPAEILLTDGKQIKDVNSVALQKIICARFGVGDSVQEKIFFAYANGNVRLYADNLFGYVKELSLGVRVKSAKLRSVDGEERLLLVGEQNAAFYTQAGSFSLWTDWDLTNVFCTCKNRLFALLKDGKLAYSDPMTPWTLGETIDDCGFIVLPADLGAPITLASVDEYVYVLFERAIIRITTSGSAREFCVEEVGYGGEKIVADSVCSTSDGVVFAAGDGVWRVKGRDVEYLCGLPVDGYADGAIYNAVAFGEKYFLRRDDGTAISLALDIQNKEWTRTYDLLGLNFGFDAPVFERAGIVYRFGGKSLPDGEISAFESLKTDFGWNGRKTLRRLTLLGEGTIVVTVDCDGKQARRTIVFEDGGAEAVFNMRGEKFSFSFAFEKGSAIRNVAVDLEK